MSEIDLSVFTASDKEAPLFIADTNGNEVITVEAGREYRLYYYFTGYSSDETLDYDVALAVNGNMIGLSSEETDNHKGYYQYYYWNLSLQSGTYTITVNLDPNNKIAESNEKNNSYSITITVPGYSNYLMDTFWSQSGYFLGYNELEINAYCPVEPGQNEHSVTGCSNTAAAQILYYFAKKGNQFTLQLDDNDKNTANSSITIDASSSNAERYDYLSFSEVNKKLEEFDVDSAEDVAALIFASGVIAGSDYGASSTSTYTSNIKTVFERAGFYGIKTAYQNSELLDNGVITDEGWEIIKSNIAAGKPVYTSIPEPSHAVVIDGYDRNTDSVHINFGWGFWGSKDDASGYAHPTGSGWYTRSECEEMKISALIYDITPDETAPVINLSKTAPADNKVVVTADFSDNVEVYGKYYQIGSTSGQWLEYNGPLTVTKNCTVYFKAVDKAKNETISNINVNGLFEVITGHVVKDGETFTATEYITAENFTVNAGGQLIIASNGVATGIKENGGFVQINSLAATVSFSANTFGNMTITSKCSLHAGTVANATTLAGTAGMYIYSGGKADNTIVDGGYIYIHSGGKADNTTLKNSGTVNVHSGGEANYTNIIGGYININSGAVANNTTLGAAGYINIKGGTANYTTVNEYGFIELINGGIVNNTVLNKSYLVIQNGCTANDTVINAGEMMVYSDGTAKNTTLNAGSHMDIHAGGEATGIKENGGFVEFDENAEVSFTANKFGDMSITSKCSLHDQTTAGDLTVNSEGEVYIYDGGKVRDTLIDGGNVYIYSGGKAENSVIIKGNLYIYSGGTHSGTLESTSAVNAGIYVEKGGIINLDISGRSADDDCLIDAGIYGSPAYCITVDANQAYGEYKLVRQSALENSTITINCGSAIYGTITIDRYNSDQINKISHDGINYIVSKKSGSLYLKINAIAPPDKPLAILSTNDPTTKPVTVSAVFDEKSVRNEYSYDGINWGTYASEFTFSSNTTIYFRSVNADGDYSDVTVCEINNIDTVKPSGSGTVNGSVKDNNIAVFDWTGIFSDNESGISHYNVKLISGKSLNTLQEFTTTDASFSQKLADGKYYLSVQAVDKAGNTGESIGSNAISIETGPPATPENLSISNDGKRITLNWSAVNDLDLSRYVLLISGDKDFSVILEEKELYKTSFSCDLDDGEYYFRITAVDHTGNHARWSEVISIALDNTPPEAPTAKADITGMTNKPVTVSADFSEDSIVRQYSLDNQNWENYTSGIKFNEKGIVYFRGQDAAGNYSEVSIYEVNNIDKTSPAKPEAKANITGMTNKPVTVSADFTEDSIIRQYSFDNLNWQEYTSGILFEDNGKIYFRGQDEAGNYSEVSIYEVNNIDKTAPEIPSVFNAFVSGSEVKLDWSDAVDDSIAGVKGYYIRYGTSELLTGDGEFITASEFNLTDLPGGVYCYQVRSVDVAGNISEWSAIQFFDVPIQNLQSSSDGLSWESVIGVDTYIVEYSTDNFANVISLEITGSGIDSIALPDGNYQWRVKTADGSCVNNGNNIKSQNNFSAPQKFVSNEDGNMDLFFANASGKWNADFFAQHIVAGSSWSGTREKVTLTGKNRLADIFEGSTDANILVMTDDSNGDALFIDDVYTALPETVTEQQARINQIDEIRAGAGDDVIDLTSPRFAYSGNDMKVYGGLGNDTIWANNGSNTLFGDAGNDRIIGGANNDVIVGGIGNDRMHGGGGSDIFCFGGNWGVDTVEQLSNGEITLWFESGSEDNWNAYTLTYTDGANSVKVSGVSSDNITLIFGDDDSLRYDELVSAGCFEDAASEKIFEDKDKGMLA